MAKQHGMLVAWVPAGRAAKDAHDRAAMVQQDQTRETHLEDGTRCSCRPGAAMFSQESTPEMLRTAWRRGVRQDGTARCSSRRVLVTALRRDVPAGRDARDARDGLALRCPAGRDARRGKDARRCSWPGALMSSRAERDARGSRQVPSIFRSARKSGREATGALVTWRRDVQLEGRKRCSAGWGARAGDGLARGPTGRTRERTGCSAGRDARDA
jgi:hypothetical protein